MRLCTFEGCGEQYHARGLCRRHYEQKYPSGTRWGPVKSDNLKPCTMGQGWQASLVSLVRRLQKEKAA